MTAEYEIAELKAQVEELQRQIWILTQGDDWLKNVKTQSLAPGGAAPANVNYLVGTGSASLSNEIAVGTSPGGELGNTWASPTVDATHSGSAHHAQAHTVASHSDTTATGTELETLTDGSDAGALHIHSAGLKSATKVVAATAASADMKAYADYVCDGTADEVQTKAAIAALP